MNTPKAFLFDIGNVIARFDFAPSAARIASGCDPVPADPLAAILEIKDRFENGELGENEFFALAIERLGYRGDPASLVALWCDIFAENQPVTRLVEALSEAGHPLFLLSNTNAPHLRHLQATYPVLARFHGGIYSHETGAMKPGEPMFHAAIERFRLVPYETLYIDDLAANIATGQRLGFLTHHYDPDNHAALLDQLADCGVRLPATV